jgi:drug/metabolite transporter (DMT)-like permease
MSLSKPNAPVTVATPMDIPGWFWIPCVMLAAAAQTVRNAAQRSLSKTAGTLAATLVRFVYGLPFALAALAITLLAGATLPPLTPAFIVWVAFGGIAQLVATGLLLAAMDQRGFIVAVAYSKTELLQVAVLSLLVLGEAVSAPTAIAIVLATFGVVLLSLKGGATRMSPRSWFSPTALMGLGSGAGFALSAIGFRGAALTLGSTPTLVGTITAVTLAQLIQSAILGAYLARRDRAALRKMNAKWGLSLLAGAMGALASMLWFTGFALTTATDVRTVGLIEVLYGYAVSWWFFKERTTGREAVGIGLLILGIAVVAAKQ